MKKFIYILVICIFFITGCGKEKKLACTKDITPAGTNISMIQTAGITFSNNKIKEIGTSILVTLSGDDKASMDEYIDLFKDSYSKQYSGNNHVKVDVSKKSDSEILIDIAFDYKSMTEEEKKNSGFYGSEDYDVNKTQLEQSGYSCK